MKILTYNIFYKAMTIQQNGKSLVSNCNPVIHNNGKIYTKCLKNVASVIEFNGPYDFIGLQEATNWEVIRDLSPSLQKMAGILHQDKNTPELLVTFYDTKYKLDVSECKILGHMKSVGRPFCILFFQCGLCVINLHAGHNRDIYDFDKHLVRTLNNSFNKNTINIYLKKFQTYKIIMMGDFNDNLSNIPYFNILSNPYFKNVPGRKLYGITGQKTCCNIMSNPNKMDKSYDHILSTCINHDIYIPKTLVSSDHLPVVAYIDPKCHIGYDFDGVLHINVGPTDKYGQRNPLTMVGPYVAANQIIKKIYSEIVSGHKIFIVTARSGSISNRKTIFNFLSSTILNPYINLISVYFTSGKNKLNVINELKINIFYDDSCVRIIQLYNGLQNEKLSHLKKLYLVNPINLNNQSLVLINTDNIKKLCGKNF